ncbi:MAG: hypothetical protein ABEN55_00260 [Bradymonadaceae bacterium]
MGIPTELRDAGETFVESVEFPYPGHEKCVYRDESDFWYRLRRMWSTRMSHGRTWPAKMKDRADEVRERYGDDPTPHEQLDIRLYEIVSDHLED